jgi:hypothetical protein
MNAGAKGLVDFMARALSEATRKQEGLAMILRGAGDLAARKHRVAIGVSLTPPGQADVIDLTAQEAHSYKTVTGSSESVIGDNIIRSADQLRGAYGERPPKGFAAVIHIVIKPSNPAYGLKRADLIRRINESIFTAALNGIRRVEIVNRTGTHTLDPAELRPAIP